MMFDPEIRDLEVPWPDMWQFREPSKRPDIRRLEWAVARELAELELWEERGDSLSRLDLPDNALERLDEYGLYKLLKDMHAADAKYPPLPEDEKMWFEAQGREWDMRTSISERREGKISDKRVRFLVSQLLHTSDHKERFRAFIIFSSLLKVDPLAIETEYAFALWKAIILDEALTEAYGWEPKLKTSEAEN